mgnify:CR=1 FL=1
MRVLSGVLSARFRALSPLFEEQSRERNEERFALGNKTKHRKQKPELRHGNSRKERLTNVRGSRQHRLPW